ncbi:MULTISPECIES: hypothetical protein [unclassified Bradyrhizobium]|uniref:hypothetical protein n=1 Tax=unclassified Bradyrhizobium TaxID=2631580 RepID=UPI0013E0EFDF|nr:hypothetical protein G6P99_21245 [Bradyrhizobium sp. 6(2017)]
MTNYELLERTGLPRAHVLVPLARIANKSIQMRDATSRTGKACRAPRCLILCRFFAMS